MERVVAPLILAAVTVPLIEAGEIIMGEAEAQAEVKSPMEVQVVAPQIHQVAEVLPHLHHCQAEALHPGAQGTVTENVEGEGSRKENRR